MASETLELFQNATKGLFYPSETDAPFEVSESQTPFTPPPNAPVIESSLADIFDPDDPEFAALRTTLEKNLTEIRVFRLGKITITIIITGKSPANTYITLKTLSVETG